MHVYNKESFNSHFQMETRGLLLKWTIWQHIGHAIAISSRTIFLTMLFVGQHNLIQSWHFLQKKKHYVTQKTTSYRRRKNIVIFFLQIQSFHLLCNIYLYLCMCGNMLCCCALLFLLQHSEKNCVGSGSDLNPRSWVSTWKISFGTHPEASSLLIIIISRQQKYHKTITNSQNNVNTEKKKSSFFCVLSSSFSGEKLSHLQLFFYIYH